MLVIRVSNRTGYGITLRHSPESARSVALPVLKLVDAL